MMPSVAELTYFFEVSNTLNFSRAAKNLCISQPSLSRAIQHLENTVGTELFIRHKKGVTLTRAGKKILLQIKPLLQNWQNTKLQALASHQQVEGHIKIGCLSITSFYIHGFLAELLEKFPKLEIELHHATADAITQQVIDLDIDIGLVPNPIPYPDLIMRKLGDSETTCWVSAEKHKIQNINFPEAVIICNPNLASTQLILQKSQIANLKFKRMLKVNSIEVIAHLTAQGCGIGILPSCLVQSLYADKLQRVPNIPVIRNELKLIYRKEHLNVAAIKTVISSIKEWAKKIIH